MIGILGKLLDNAGAESRSSSHTSGDLASDSELRFRSLLFLHRGHRLIQALGG